MALKKNTIITIPALNDFLYTVLYEATLQDKRGLTGRFLKATTTAKAARRFIENSTREEKEHLLSHFKFSFYYVIHANKVTIAKFRDILKQFEKNRRVAATKEIANEGIFVTTDVQFCALLGLMAKSTNDPSYYRNLELNRQGYHIKRWKKRLNSKEDFANKELDENDTMLARTLHANMGRYDIVEPLINLSQHSIRILTYLYVYKNNAVSEGEIRRQYEGEYTPRQITVALKTLKNQGCITEPLLKKGEYSITSIGIRKYCEYRDMTLKSTDF